MLFSSRLGGAFNLEASPPEVWCDRGTLVSSEPQYSAERSRGKLKKRYLDVVRNTTSPNKGSLTLISLSSPDINTIIIIDN